MGGNGRVLKKWRKTVKYAKWEWWEVMGMGWNGQNKQKANTWEGTEMELR